MKNKTILEKIVLTNLSKNNYYIFVHIIIANIAIEINKVAEVTTIDALSLAAAKIMSAFAVPQAMLDRAELIADIAVLN